MAARASLLRSATAPRRTRAGGHALADTTGPARWRRRGPSIESATGPGRDHRQATYLALPSRSALAGLGEDQEHSYPRSGRRWLAPRSRTTRWHDRLAAARPAERGRATLYRQRWNRLHRGHAR